MQLYDLLILLFIRRIPTPIHMHKKEDAFFEKEKNHFNALRPLN